MKIKISITKAIIIVMNTLLAYFKVYSKVVKIIIPQNSTLISAVSEILVYTITTVVSVYMVIDIIIRDIKLITKRDLNIILSITVLLLVVSSVFSSLISAISSCERNYLEPENYRLIILIFTAIICAPVYEEIFCRVVLFQIFKGVSVGFAIVASSFIFSVLHLSSMTHFISTQNVLNLLIYFSLGVCCQVLYIKYKNIFYPILMHCFWNSFMLLGILFRKM